MVDLRSRRKIVKALPKGQVTIPREFREALGIQADTLLDISLAGDHLEIRPLRQAGPAFRRYSDEDIARFLDEDKLDEETAARVHDLLRRGAL